MLTRRKTFVSAEYEFFFPGEESSYQECCEKHVLIDQKRCISKEDSALDSGEKQPGTRHC